MIEKDLSCKPRTVKKKQLVNSTGRVPKDIVQVEYPRLVKGRGRTTGYCGQEYRLLEINVVLWC